MNRAVVIAVYLFGITTVGFALTVIFFMFIASFFGIMKDGHNFALTFIIGAAFPYSVSWLWDRIKEFRALLKK